MAAIQGNRHVLYVASVTRAGIVCVDHDVDCAANSEDCVMKRASPSLTYVCQRCGGWFKPPPGRTFRPGCRQDGHAKLIIWCDECEGIS